MPRYGAASGTPGGFVVPKAKVNKAGFCRPAAPQVFIRIDRFCVDAVGRRHHQLRDIVLERFHQLADLIPDAMLLLAVDGTVHAANPAAVGLLGHSGNELTGCRLSQFIHCEGDSLARSIGAWSASYGFAPDGPVCSGTDTRLLRLRLEGAAYRMQQEGLPALVLVRLTPGGGDEVETPIQDPIHEMGDHKVPARSLDSRQDEFLAMLGHELRNPLAPLASGIRALELLPGLPQQTQVPLAAMNRQVRHLTRLVDDLVDVSRVTRGRVRLNRLPVRVADLMAAAAEIARPAVKARGHALLISLPPNSLYVTGDMTRLCQVMANILINAAQYTPANGRVEFAAEGSGHQIEIRVRDNGAGIAADLLPHVFELFSQGQRPLDRSQGGLGLGLTVARRLVELHGGSIAAHSEGAGRGCLFTVRLPVAAIEPGAPAPKVDADAAPMTAAKKILVVDDNLDITASFAMLLELQGHEVRTANDGTTAIALSKEFGPQVVLLDLGLPGMDGFELAGHIGQLALEPRPLLIAMTGYGQDADRERSLRAGFQKFLVKPVDFEALEKLLAAA
ncbi:MAG: domain S-box protein [Nevskia sp.]|nr:domain S-box protein [Nevskia sp.]